MTDKSNQTDGSLEFSSLILGFSSAALSYLGVVAEGSKEKPAKNLELAKQNIDIIAVLKEKTTGNLTDDEKKLLDTVLADLRIKYVDASKLIV